MSKEMSPQEFSALVSSPAALYASACNQRDVLRECNAALRAERDALLEALQAFVDRGAKLSGFPSQYDPFVGELVHARAALTKVRK